MFDGWHISDSHCSSNPREAGERGKEKERKESSRNYDLLRRNFFVWALGKEEEEEGAISQLAYIPPFSSLFFPLCEGLFE